MQVLALDTETTGLSYWDTAFCVSAAWRNDKGELESVVYYDNTFRVPPAVSDFVFHNAKFDLQKMQLSSLLATWDWRNIHDTECLIHLVDEQQPKALKRLAKDLLGLDTDEADVLRAARTKLKLTKKDGYDALPRDVLEPYALKDAEFTLLLFEHLWPIVSNDAELLSLYREEQELMGVLYDMEAKGLGVDLDYVNEKAKELAGEILATDLHIRDMVGDEDFNSGSWQQITAALAERGIKVGSTAKAVLVTLDDDLARAILSIRHNTKLYSTYFKPLQAEVKDGILHPNHKQWGTRGRRFAAGKVEDG